MRKAIVAGVAFAASLTWASAASALTYIIKYTGVVTSNELNYGDTFMVGDQTGTPVSVEFIYHLQNAKIESTAEVFRYFSAEPALPMIDFNIRFLGKATFGASGNTFSEVKHDLVSNELSSTAIRDLWSLTAAFNPLTPTADLRSDYESQGTGFGAFDISWTGTALKGTFNLDSVSIGLDGGNVSPVPEPATWAMMIAGFGLAGAALRNRRATITA